MPEWTPPMLGLDTPRNTLVTWQDGTVVYRGILGDLNAEQAQDLRSHDNVVLLSDWRKSNE